MAGSTRTTRKSAKPADGEAPAEQPQLPGSPTDEDLGNDQGFLGDKTDPRPNEAYSQETDPLESPGAADVVNDGRQAADQEEAA